MVTYAQKAPFNDWWYWSECIVKRFRTAAELLREREAPAMYAADLEKTANYLKELFAGPARGLQFPPKTDEEKYKQRQKEENAIFDAANKFRELLIDLPFICEFLMVQLAVDWQKATYDSLKNAKNLDDDDEDDWLPSSKKKKSKGGDDRRVVEIFWGPKERLDEGLRSGKIKDGGLPGILYNMLVAEKTQSNRAPPQIKNELQQTMNQWDKLGMQTGFTPRGGM